MIISKNIWTNVESLIGNIWYNLDKSLVLATITPNLHLPTHLITSNSLSHDGTEYLSTYPPSLPE